MKSNIQLLRLLRSILNRVESIHAIAESGKKQIDAEVKNAQSNKREEKVLQVAVSEVKLPEKIYDHLHSNEDDGKWQKRNFVLTVITLLVTSITGLVVGLQWKAMVTTVEEMKFQSKLIRETLEATKEQFRIDQQPYVAISKLDPVPLRIGREIHVNLHVTNLGKSPAQKLVPFARALFGPTARSEVDRVYAANSTGFGSVLGAGQDQWITVNSFEEVDVEGSPLKPWDGSWPILLVGKATYSDIFGNTYITQYCLNWLKTGAFMHNCGANGTQKQSK